MSAASAPPIATPAVIATKAAGNRFGGKGGRFPRPTEQTHDLHMAGVFLYFRQRDPKAVKTWESEELIRRRQRERSGEKLPDAMIRLKNRNRIIEFGGAYGKEKLIEFHEYCRKRGLAYEIW